MHVNHYLILVLEYQNQIYDFYLVVIAFSTILTEQNGAEKHKAEFHVFFEYYKNSSK
jgi:hypothetical protein